MRRSNATTLQDVAREAGVTAMTVSVVLNGARSATRVSDATRARIQEAAVRLRYRPNAAARGLQRRRMDTLGIIAHMDGAEVNLYFLEVLNGILEEASARGQNSTVFSVSDWCEDEQRILHFCDGRTDGMILIAPRLSPACSAALHHRTAFVTLHGNHPQPGIWNLDVDNEAGAFAAVTDLIEQGHRQILHISGQIELDGARARIAGYRRALESAGIESDPALICYGNYSRWAGRTMIEQILSEGRHAGGNIDSLPTAVFCASDAIAAGCIEKLGDYGIRVPEDVSVVGFDDTIDALTTNPRLTTVRQPFRQMGRRAVEVLLAQIEADGKELRPSEGTERDDSRTEISPPGTILLPVELIRRGSVNAPRDAPITLPLAGR